MNHALLVYLSGDSTEEMSRLALNSAHTTFEEEPIRPTPPSRPNLHTIHEDSLGHQPGSAAAEPEESGFGGGGRFAPLFFFCSSVSVGKEPPEKHS